MIQYGATIGAAQSTAIGPVHPEMQTDSGKLLHDALLSFDMALPATFQKNNEASGTWCRALEKVRLCGYISEAAPRGRGSRGRPPDTLGY